MILSSSQHWADSDDILKKTKDNGGKMKPYTNPHTIMAVDIKYTVYSFDYSNSSFFTYNTFLNLIPSYTVFPMESFPNKLFYQTEKPAC